MPVGEGQNSLIAEERGLVSIQHMPFIEKLMHFDRERNPERAVHMIRLPFFNLPGCNSLNDLRLQIPCQCSPFSKSHHIKMKPLCSPWPIGYFPWRNHETYSDQVHLLFLSIYTIIYRPVHHLILEECSPMLPH